MFRIIGVFAIIPATVLLTISFFVLFSLRKIEANVLKSFGYVIAALLWLCTLLVFSVGIYTLSTGRCILKEAMRSHHKMSHGMMGEGMPQMMPMQK